MKMEDSLEADVSRDLEDVGIKSNSPLTALLTRDLGKMGFFWDLQRRV